MYFTQNFNIIYICEMGSGSYFHLLKKNKQEKRIEKKLFFVFLLLILQTCVVNTMQWRTINYFIN